MRVARKIEAGQVFVNNCGAGGGVKKSGHGREKGFAPLHDFAAPKSMVFKHN